MSILSILLLSALSVCSLISLSVSSYVLVSPTGPSCCHGDESRHRLSAAISSKLPTGVFVRFPSSHHLFLVLSSQNHTLAIQLFTRLPFYLLTPLSCPSFGSPPPLFLLTLFYLFSFSPSPTQPQCLAPGDESAPPESHSH